MGGCSSSQKTTAEPEQQRTPRRRALLVGMDYRGAPAGWPIINGTRNDVKVFDTLLREHWGFSEEDIVTVTDPAEHRVPPRSADGLQGQPEAWRHRRYLLLRAWQAGL